MLKLTYCSQLHSEPCSLCVGIMRSLEKHSKLELSVAEDVRLLLKYLVTLTANIVVRENRKLSGSMSYLLTGS